MAGSEFELFGRSSTARAKAKRVRSAHSAWLGVLLLPLFLLLLSSVATAEDAEQDAVEQPITELDRDHWSFQPLQRPTLPHVKDPKWIRNPIDHFVLATLERKGLAPLPDADRMTLIRRLYFDLIGLPPSTKEVDAFVADPSPDAYERLVDRLLGSNQFGLRWAQHWLDLARFAETDGFEHDKVRSEAWKYRDWVIEALNQDLPYDRFVVFQLAGDEIAAGDEDARVATSFCLSGPDMPDINSQEERRHNVLNELTATVGSVLLGLQMGCAQCHDHKYDPISQADFYRLRAVFEPAVHVEKNKSVSVLGEKAPPKPSHLMIRGDWRRPGVEVAPAFPRIANPDNAPFTPDSSGAGSGRRRELARWVTSPQNPLATRVIANRLWQHHFGEGLTRTPSDFGIIGDSPSHPELLDWLATELIQNGWSLKKLHRLIVMSSTYRQASVPGHASGPEGEKIAEPSWRQSLEADPNNFWLARYPRKRLSGESIRDSMLAAAGVLNLEQGGPGVRPPLPKELVQTLLRNQWTVSPDAADHYRRSIYVFARRNLRYPIFEAFDRPDGNASCSRRSRSTTAPQALLLLNSQFALEAARRMAGGILLEAGSPDDQVTLASYRALGRRPSEQERALLLDFLETQRSILAEEERAGDSLALPLPCPAEVDPLAAAALTDLCLALFNSNEFLYID